LDGLPDSYDAMAEFGRRLKDLPLRPDWPYLAHEAVVFRVAHHYRNPMYHGDRRNPT
jgi:hypothetical protein